MLILLFWLFLYICFYVCYLLFCSGFLYTDFICFFILLLFATSRRLRNDVPIEKKRGPVTCERSYRSLFCSVPSAALHDWVLKRGTRHSLSPLFLSSLISIELLLVRELKRVNIRLGYWTGGRTRFHSEKMTQPARRFFWPKRAYYILS
jgi:hypothetical protein